jgi:hypothetical protein
VIPVNALALSFMRGLATPLAMEDAAAVFHANCHEGRATTLKIKGIAVTFTLTRNRITTEE